MITDELRESFRVPGKVGARLVAAAAGLFRESPWDLLCDADVLQLDVPALGVTGWCASVLGSPEAIPGLGLFRSAAECRALGHLAEHPEVDPKAESIMLGYATTEELDEHLPEPFARELRERGWDLGTDQVYPVWLQASLDTELCGLADERQQTILLAATLGMIEHVRRYRGELDRASAVPTCMGEYAVELDSGVVTVHLTSPHPGLYWPRELEAAEAAVRDARQGGKLN